MTKPFATVLEKNTSLNNKTGSWRTLKPEYVRRLPPCNVTCPAGENIQQWLSFAQEKKYKEAWEVMVESNPFPACMGRVCYYTCEKVCNRGQFDGSVNINLLERSIGDMAIKEQWHFKKPNKKTGKKILIIGAGPSGLSAAYFLRNYGHDVTVFEAHQKNGGMMRYGVPKYRLPRNILDAEIKRITDLGVNIENTKKVKDFQKLFKEYDAIYISTGAHKPIDAKITIKNNANVINAIDMFKQFEDGTFEPDILGNKVLVYGGGNTAIDAARTALRFGVNDVKIAYRRTINNMPAHDIGIQEALSEGIEILCLRTIEYVDSHEVCLNKMNYDEENAILSKTSEQEIFEANCVITAIGQLIDDDLFFPIDELNLTDKNTIEVDIHLMTNIKGVFAGGDTVHGNKTITHAIGFGKKAAKNINDYLNGEPFKVNKKNEIANIKKLNTYYFEKNTRTEFSRLGDLSFNEKNISYNAQRITDEAERCFSCGNCFHCDNCYGYCPDNAIIKKEDGSLEFNYDYCKGCGICANECPCGAIKMVIDEK